MEPMIACLDFGGSSMKTALCRRNGEMLHKASYPMCDDLDSLLSVIKKHITTLQETYEIEGVAISSCGAVDTYSGCIGGASAIPFIHGPSWKELIQNHIGLPCEIENDANCAALSELYYGKAQEVNNMAFMVIGTGIGGAVVQNRRIQHGPHLYGGEFGMMLVQDEAHNIVNYSLVASTSSMVRKMEALQPDTWDGKRIFEEAENGNEDCIHTIDRFYDWVAYGVFNIQHMLDPEMILFGGAISARPDFTKRVLQSYRKLQSQMDFKTITPHLECCTYLQDANLLGALAHYSQLHNQNN